MEPKLKSPTLQHMEKLKLQSTVMPENRPTEDEWVREFSFGTLGKSLSQIKEDIVADKQKELMRGYDFTKLKFKITEDGA